MLSGVRYAPSGRSSPTFLVRRWGQILIVGALVIVGLCCASGPTPRQRNLSTVHHGLGENYFARKMPERAKKELFKALELDPENHQANFLLGAIFFLEGVHAINYIDRAQCLRGAAAREQRRTADARLQRAEKHLRRAMKHTDDKGQKDSEGLNYLANIALHFERYDEAVKLCTVALDNILYASQHLALCNRGWAHFRKGDLSAAARDLRQALFHQSAFCLARFRLGKVYFAQKDYLKATRELENVVKQEDCPIQESYHVLGLTYLKRGMQREAQDVFERCVKLSPRSCVAQECRRYAKLI